MWTFLTRLILRYRFANLVVIALLTIFMGWQGSKVQMSYNMARMLPSTDPAILEYEKFKGQFGEDGSVIFVGIQDPNLFQLDHFNKWYELTNKIRKIQGVQEAVSVARIYQLVRNDSIKRFNFSPVVSAMPKTQAEVDSIKRVVTNLSFYEGLLFNTKSDVSMMMITLDRDVLNTKKRVALVYEIKETMDTYNASFGVDLHYSGLPYIRTITAKKIQNELVLFIFLSILIAFLTLLAFFRSPKIVSFIILVVLISVVMVFGTVQLLGYKITILTGILPPILIVIGVENSIFLMNKYYHEFRIHGNKIKALSRVIRRIGAANVLTNAATATGFAAFVITGNVMLVEFGIVAAINIMLAFFLSLFLIPILFSYLAEPKPKQFQYFEKGNINIILRKITWTVIHRRTVIYFVTIILIFIGIFGISRLETTGNMVDDISHKETLYKDLMFFEKHFHGVMPFEISIDTKKPKGILRTSTLNKLSQLQDTLALYKEFSKPLSIVEVVKFSKQAFFRGDPSYYSLPNSQEKNFILGYVPQLKSEKKTIMNAFVDTSLQITRVSVQMANISTKKIDSIQTDLKPKIEKLFPHEEFDVLITGSSLIFLKGTNFLVHNLLESLLFAIVLIALLMAGIFSSIKMIVISLIPNIFPQLLTAAMMGFTGIPIKPSTIIIFSIALGISVDNTIQFLSRYRQQLIVNKMNIHRSVLAALHETGFSMIYSSIVLFFGFAIFILSSFGGTEALGYLVSFTLLVALIANLFLLPSLLLSLDRRITTKAFTSEPLLEILDEESDLELDDLEIEKLITEK
ncbi:MAG: MMPL family transporter [Bacteroidales bacterium]|nr:MMPL family transporter [Bacteroidales bacterium]